NFSNLMQRTKREQRMLSAHRTGAQSKATSPEFRDPQPSDLLTLTPPRQTTDLVGGGWPQDCHIVFRNYNMIFVLDITMRIGYHISRIFILWSSTMPNQSGDLGATPFRPIPLVPIYAFSFLS